MADKPMLEPALIISILALFFTVFSFWWMNWRPGKLVLTEPRSYAAIAAADKVIIELPLVFFNTGATPIVVHNLHLTLPGVDRPLFFNAVVQKLGDHDDRRFATQFAVRQREAVTLICEFQGQVSGFAFERREYPVLLEWVRGNSRKWRELLQFPLTVTLKTYSHVLPALQHEAAARMNAVLDRS
jgi:hypothetical protein